MTPLCMPHLSRCIASRPAGLTSAQRRKQIIRPSAVVCDETRYQGSPQPVCGDTCAQVVIRPPVAHLRMMNLMSLYSLPCKDTRDAENKRIDGLYDAYIADIRSRQPVSEVARAEVVFTDSVGMSIRLDLDRLELQPPQFHTGGLVLVDRPDPPLDPEPPPKPRHVGVGNMELLPDQGNKW